MDIKKYLFNKKNQVKVYNLFQQLEKQSIYNDCIQTTNPELSDFLYHNYDSMTLEEKKQIVTKCLTDNGINNILLKFELKNLDIQTKKLNLIEFKKIAIKILERYQSKSGGFCFGHTNWILHDCNSKKINVYENEVIFENTIYENQLHSDETVEFLHDILNILNKISSLIKVSLHTKYHERDKINVLLLKCVEKNE